MINPKVYAKIFLNSNRTVADLGQIRLRNAPVLLAEFIRDMDIDSQTLSTLRFEISKRPINSDEVLDEFDQMIQSNLLHVPEHKSTDPLDGFPDITWGEYMELMEDSIFSNMKRLSESPDRSKWTGDEIESITNQFRLKYSDTKFAKLVR